MRQKESERTSRSFDSLVLFIAYRERISVLNIVPGIATYLGNKYLSVNAKFLITNW